MKDKVNAIPLIGEIIKEELNKQGKTTVWLAEQLGCHRTNIYKVNRLKIQLGLSEDNSVSIFETFSILRHTAFCPCHRHGGQCNDLYLRHG